MTRDNVVSITADVGTPIGALKRDWRYFGYDECNYTTAPEGRTQIAKFGGLEDGPYFIRAHHLLCTGNCHGTYKWGSTNAYSEQSDGEPVYEWSVIDEIIDVYLENGMKPFFEIGFMPMDLADPRFAPNGIGFKDYRAYRDTGWACPPKDYHKWYDLVRKLLTHCVERYGRDEVRAWYWELWNEPDIFYWKGSIEEFCKLYDFTEAAVHSVMSEARLGGPATTGPAPGSTAHVFLAKFLRHCAEGTNHLTGAKGTRLDFVTFHVKGGGFPFQLHARKATPSIRRLTSQVKVGLETIREYGFGDREVVLSEADPDGWAAGGRFDNANLNFRNTEYYASYMAVSYQQIRDIADSMEMDVRPLAWAFMFVGERCFEGTRAFSTQGIDKAVFNLFRMYARLQETRCHLTASSERESKEEINVLKTDSESNVSGIATTDGKGDVRIMVATHHDDWDDDSGHSIRLIVRGLGAARKYRVRHYRIDADHSNAYSEWVRLGRPSYPNDEQLGQIDRRSGLEQLEAMETETDRNGEIRIDLSMASHAVSLLELE